MSYVQGKRLTQQCKDEGKRLLSEQLGSKKANKTLQCTRQGTGEQSEQCNASVDQCFALLWALCVVPGSSALEEHCKINGDRGRAAEEHEKASAIEGAGRFHTRELKAKLKKPRVRPNIYAFGEGKLLRVFSPGLAPLCSTWCWSCYGEEEPDGPRGPAPHQQFLGSQLVPHLKDR